MIESLLLAVVNIIDDSDGLLVHGGNTFYLLQEMQRVGFGDFLRGYLDLGSGIRDHGFSIP